MTKIQQLKTIAEYNLQQYFLKECEAHGLIMPKRVVVELAIGMAIAAAIPLVLGALKIFTDNQQLHRETAHLNIKFNSLQNEFALMNKTYEVCIYHNFYLY